MIKASIYFSSSSLANIDSPPTRRGSKDSIALKLLGAVQNGTLKDFIGPIATAPAFSPFALELKASDTLKLIKIIFENFLCLPGLWPLEADTSKSDSY